MFSVPTTDLCMWTDDRQTSTQHGVDEFKSFVVVFAFTYNETKAIVLGLCTYKSA